MYLSGMDIYDIMKITGHSSPATLKKYIKANELEVVYKIVVKYNYFDQVFEPGVEEYCQSLWM